MHTVHPIYVDMRTPLHILHTRAHICTHMHASKAKNMVAVQNTATAAQWTSTGVPVHHSTQASGSSAGKS